MMIIDTDNFDRDFQKDHVVATGITNRRFGETMAEALNVTFGGGAAERFYKLVEDDYKLAPGFEP